MGAVGAIAPIFSLASMGFNFMASQQQGAGTKAANDAQAARLARAADYGRTSASQHSAAMTEDLSNTLGNITAIRAASGADVTSPTTAAYRDRQEMIGTRKKNITVANILAQSQQDDSDAAYLKQSGQYAMDMGTMSGIGGLLKGFGGINWGGLS